MMTRLKDILTRTRREIVTEGELVLLFRKGKLIDVLNAGEHRVKRNDRLDRIDLATFEARSAEARLLRRALPEQAAAHLTEVAAGAGEMAVLLRDDRAVSTVGPLSARVYWTAAGPWSVERHALGAGGLLPDGVGDRLVARDRGRVAAAATALGLRVQEVADGHVGFLVDGGVTVAELAPGRHWTLVLPNAVALRCVDLRRRTHDVTGQEVLTKDRVTLRVNLTADVRVTDARVALESVNDFDAALHRSLQLALRRVVGTRTLDQLLADKVVFDAEAAEAVRAEMAGMGVEVGAIALRDVVLPGEMRDILTSVVAAEKEAEVGVIRRREEANDTRALLNTAKVMADNPVMLRLKELEALERVAGKVERLTVHNGTAGLLGDIARLRD